MATFEEMLNEALKQAFAPPEERKEIFKTMVKRTEAALREKKLFNIEAFINSCEVLSNGNVEMQSRLLDLLLSRIVVGDNLHWCLEARVIDRETAEDSKKLGALASGSVDLHIQCVIDIATAFKNQKRTIESLTAALAYGKEATSEA